MNAWMDWRDHYLRCENCPEEGKLCDEGEPLMLAAWEQGP